MYPERKCAAKKVVSLFAAASILLTMTPGITVSADDTAFSGAVASATILEEGGSGETDEAAGDEDGSGETGEPAGAEGGSGETGEPAGTEGGSGETGEPAGTEGGSSEMGEPAGAEDDNSDETDEATGDENGTVEVSEYSENDADGISLYSNAQEIVGDLIVIGGTEADGDFTYDSYGRLLTITSDKTLTIKNVDPTTSTTDRIIIKNGISANIVLDGVNLKNNNYAGISVGTVSVTSNATIILADNSQNIIEGYGAAIQVNYKQVGVTITCEHADEEGHKCGSTCGSLKATGGSYGAGIGSAKLDGIKETGSITIKGGNIEATGGNGAGIGSAGELPLTSSISISGGNIKATGGNGGAGIGSGFNSAVNGSINITGGKIAAFGSYQSGTTICCGTGIGSGYGGYLGGSINISGGEIYAKAGGDNTGNAVGIGAAINTNVDDNTGKIIISDGCVYAIGSGSSAAIGYSDGISKECSIEITGGLVKAEGGSNSSSAMSSVPCDDEGNKLGILEIDNSDGKSVTVNGVEYPSVFTYNDGTADHTEKTLSLYVPINRRTEVVLTSSSGYAKSYSYYYTNNDKLENIDGIKYDVYPTNSGDTLVYGTDFTYNKANYTTIIKTDKPITIKNINSHYGGPIKIENGYDADITLAGMKNWVFSGQGSGIYVDEDNINNIKITLADGTENECIVEASDEYSAIRCSSSTLGSLTITCEHSEEPGHICDSNCGSLIASITGKKTLAEGASEWIYSAAIGSETGKNAGNIIINGGNITAISTYGAAIGCGKGGYLRGNITINGGVIDVNSSLGGSYPFCAIGSNTYDDNSGEIIINGGIITAECGKNNYDIDGGQIIINDGVVLLKDNQYQNKNPFNSEFAPKNSSGDNVYLLTINNENGEEVKINGNALPYKYLSDSDKNLYLYIAENPVTVEVGSNKTIYALSDGRFLKMGTDLVITAADGGADLVCGTDYEYVVSEVNDAYGTFELGELKIYTDRKVEVKNADGIDTTQDYIVAANNTSSCNIVLAGVNIELPYLFSLYSAIKIDGDTSANIILKDGTENHLKTGSDSGCGIQKDGTGVLYIACESAGTSSHECNDSCGKLFAESSSGAAIGTSQKSYYENAYGGAICIAGGNINAVSTHGAAIGGGMYCGIKDINSNGGITITGGIIYAESNNESAAIGSGNDGDASSITIENCRVTATGRILYAAAIGSGKNGNASDIKIENAYINAKSEGGAAIGSGLNGKCDGITIADSVVYAETSYGAAVIGGGKNGIGDNITIKESIVSLNSTDYYPQGNDIIGNGCSDGSQTFANATNIVISRSSVKVDTTVQTSPIKDDATLNPSQVYLLTFDNPNGAKIYVNGSEAITKGYNNTAADPNDTYVYLWVAESENYDIMLVDVDGTTTTFTYHFNPERKTDIYADAFKLCEADTESGYLHDETGHWYKCKGSDTCTEKHDYEEHSGTATCTNKPVCSICGTKYGTPLGHDMTKHTAVAAACTTVGNKKYYSCGNCGKLFTDVNGKNETTLADVTVKALGHDMTRHSAVEAACTTAGNKEYYSCGNCGKLFTDVNGKNETTLADVTIKVLGHDMTKHTAVAAACTTAGNKEYYSCGNCGKLFTDVNGKNEVTVDEVTINALGHDMTKHTAVAAACTTVGNKEYYSCGNCGKLFTDVNGKNEVTVDDVTINALGHYMMKHDYIKSTCEIEGNIEYYSCGNCGKLFTDKAGKNETTLADVTLPLEAHKFSTEWEYDNAGHWHLCTVCGNADKKAAHVSSGPATETEHEICTVCGRILTYAFGHIHANHTVLVAAKQPTCTEDGNIKYYECDCGKLFADVDGKNEVTVDDVTINALGHDMTKHSAVEATCTTAGNKEYYSCGNCGKLFADENGDDETTLAAVTIKATGVHKYGDWTITKEASCTDNGERAHTCVNCGEVRTEIIKALGHKYGNWEIIKNATKNNEGLKQRKCKVCGDVDEKPIPKLASGSSGSGSKWFPDDTNPSVNGEIKPWDSVRTDILNMSDDDVITIAINEGDRIPENIIRALKTTGGTGEFVINDVISIIIDGKKVTNVTDDIRITLAAGDTNGLRGSIIGTVGINGMNVPFGVKVKLKSENEGRFFNLYRNNNGEKIHLGTAVIGADGTAIVSVSEGGELAAMSCEFSDILGDADNDGAVNAKDAAHLLRFVVGLGQLNNPKMADFDGSGAANAHDAAAILRKVVGL